MIRVVSLHIVFTLSMALFSATVFAQGSGTKPSEPESKDATAAQPGSDEATGATSGKVPKIVVDQSTFDFGKIEGKSSVEHTFTLRNEGEGTLEIEKAKPSCGCTVANLSSKILAPGEEATLTAKLNLKGRTGTQRKTITVESNDLKTPRKVLTLSGKVIAEFEFNPRHVFFNQIADNEEVERVVTVTSRKGVEIVGVTTKVSHIDVALETVEKGKEYKANVKTVPPLPKGQKRGSIQLLSDNPQKPVVVTIPVSSFVVGDLAVLPEKIVVTETEAQHLTRYLMVRPGKIKEFEIKDVEVSDTNIAINVVSLGNSGHRIQLDNITPSPALSDSYVLIKTDVESMPEIKVPFEFK